MYEFAVSEWRPLYDASPPPLANRVANGIRFQEFIGPWSPLSLHVFHIAFDV